MRIIAGKHRSIQLEAPQDNTRPTSDRLKESLFNSMFQQTFHQVWLDLFAGSGAVGIEALSRGAQHVVFSDTFKEAITCIETNLAKIGESDYATVLHQDALTTLHTLEEKGIIVDVVFCDPPYALDSGEIIQQVIYSSAVANNALLIIEQAFTDKEYNIDEKHNKLKERKVGKSVYRIYQLSK
jgi:16S rRNA (guanine966-N2)-methyltransferase